MDRTSSTDRFFVTAARLRFAMLRDLCEAAAMVGLACATALALF